MTKGRRTRFVHKNLRAVSIETNGKITIDKDRNLSILYDSVIVTIYLYNWKS